MDGDVKSNNDQNNLFVVAANINVKNIQLIAYTLLFPKNAAKEQSKISIIKLKAIQGIEFTILYPKEPKILLLSTPTVITEKEEQSVYIDKCKNKGLLTRILRLIKTGSSRHICVHIKPNQKKVFDYIRMRSIN